MTVHIRSRRQWAAAAASVLALTLTSAWGQAPAQADVKADMKVYPLKTSLAEETFQTLIVTKALEQLGYDIQAIQEVEYPAAHLAIGNGDATLMAVHWNPMHTDFYARSGGDAKLFRKGALINSVAQGYLIDKKTADAHGITNIAQLQDPKLAKLFDTNGDGKADLTGCPPGWSCDTVIEHHLDAYKLRATVTHNQGNYAALIGDTITRYKAGQPVLYFTWTPFWVSYELKPGQDVVWLEVPFSAAPGGQSSQDSRLPNGKNYGFVVNQQQIVANKAWVDKHPAAGRLFEVMHIPLKDINAQNYLVRQGQDKHADIERHADAWIKAHQKTFDGWLAHARGAAAK